MLNVDELPTLFSAWRQRQAARDERIELIDKVVSGDLSVFDQEDLELKSRSPNLIQVALEDTAEAAGLVPTIRVTPHRTSDLQKKRAAKMERIATYYLDAARQELLVIQSVMDLAAFGLCPWFIWPDVDQRIPLITKRDPRTCYPEPGFQPGEAVRRVMFARNVYWSQLPEAYRQVMVAGEFVNSSPDPNTQITLVEYVDDTELVVAGLYESRNAGYLSGRAGSFANAIPIEFDRITHNLGVCPVVIGSRITLDGEFRGQFDQVVDQLEAHIQLTSMVIDYADQAVYSDIWVRDLVGELPYGGGAYIELGPNGAIGRVPPAVSSFAVSEDLQRLTEGIHIGARYPKSRPGDIDQAIASAKFVEAVAGVMNTAIKTYHLILKRSFEQALRIAFMVDKKMFPGTKTMAGILRNQEFLEEYTTDDIELENQIRAEYGLGLGRDPAQAAVLMLQYRQNGYISGEFVRENIDGVTDVAREEVRIDVERFRDIMFAKLLQGVQDGTIPDTALVEIARARQNGESLVELFDRYVAEPQRQALEQSLQPGLGPPVPAGVTPDQLAGTEGQRPPAPPAPQPSSLLARLGVPAGKGGALSAAVRPGGTPGGR